jgi:titin
VAGDGDIRLSWTAPANGGSVIRDYVIERSTDAAFTAPVTIADGVSTTTSFTVTGLPNGTAQWFRVRAVNAVGTGAWCATTSATPLAYRAAVLADAPVAYWRLGEPSGATFRSETGTGLSMTAAGTVTSSTADALPADADRAVDLAGAGDLRGSNTAAVQLTEGTVEAWVKATSPGAGYRGIVVKQSAFGLFLVDGVVSAYDWGTGTNRSTGVNVADGQWHHVAMTFRSGVANGTVIHVDGQPVLTTTITVLNQSVAPVVGAGHDSGTQRLTGSVDEAAIYSTVLSPDRIAAHHRAGITGTNDGIAPAVPTGLAATPGAAQVSLSWNAVADADLVGYQVFRDGTLVAQQTGTSFTDTGRTNGVSHTYTVEAYDTRGNRSALTTPVVATPRVTPGAPTGLTATPNGDRTVGLAWTAPTVLGEPPLTDYRVEVRPQGGSWSVFADGVSTAISATVSDLTVGTTYEFKVTPVHAVGDGAPSSVATAQAQALWTPADIPGGLALWLDAADAASLTVAGGQVSEWRDRSGWARHAVQTDPSRRPTFTATDARAGGRPTVGAPTGVGLIGLDLPSFAMRRFVGVVGFGNGTETTFAGYPTLVAGPGSWGVPRFGMGSNGTSSWFSGDTLTGTSFRNGEVSASATALPMPLGIQRFDFPSVTSSTWTLGYNANAADRNWRGPISEVVAFADLAISASDLQRLEGYLAHRWGTAASLPADHPFRTVPPLTATPAAPPAAPTSLLLTPTSGQVALSWTAPTVSGTPIRDYVIEHRPSGGSWTTLADGVSTGTSATVTGLTDGVTYEFRVAAVSAAGTGAWANGSSTLGVLWTPAYLAGGLALWLDAADASTFTSDAAGVSEWQDRSGLGNHATQATGSVRPERNASGWVEFRGTDFMTGTMAAETLPSSLQATVAFRKTTGTNAHEAHPFTRGAGNVGRPLDYYTTNLFTGNASTHASVGAVNIASQTSWTTLSTLISAPLIRQHRNGTLATDSPGNRPYSDPLGTYHLGTRADRVTQLTGDVREIVITAQLSDGDRQRLEGYLAWKWGTVADLPAGHPYRNAPPMLDAPTGLTATAAPGAVNLSWTAAPESGGAAPTDYTVHYRAQGASAWTTFADGVSTTTTASVTGLTATTTYEFRIGAVYAEGAGSWSTSASATVVPWTPANLSGVAAWYDAADAGTVTLNGSTVSEWRDRSGNDRHVAQPTAGKQPTYTTSGSLQNGLNVLTFDGNQRSLFASSSVLSLTPPFTRFIAARFEGKANSSVLIDSDTTSNQAVFYNGENGSNWVAAQGIAPNFANFAYGTRDFLDHQHVHVINGATSSWGLDGSAMTGPLNPGPSGMPGIRIGHVRTELHPQYAFQGRIYEIVLVSGVVSEADRQRVEGYLAHKWGLTANLPAGHPYRAAPPTT